MLCGIHLGEDEALSNCACGLQEEWLKVVALW